VRIEVGYDSPHINRVFEDNGFTENIWCHGTVEEVEDLLITRLPSAVCRVVSHLCLVTIRELHGFSGRTVGSMEKTQDLCIAKRGAC
jgi:hypothetical protein